MANTRAAKKRVRQIARQTEVNRARRSRVRTHLRRVEEAIGKGDKEAAQTAFRAAEPELARGARTGVLHRNTVSRKLSRLAARIKAL